MLICNVLLLTVFLVILFNQKFYYSLRSLDAMNVYLLLMTIFILWNLKLKIQNLLNQSFKTT